MAAVMAEEPKQAAFDAGLSTVTVTLAKCEPGLSRV
jgi:hypothetical protein